MSDVEQRVREIIAREAKVELARVTADATMQELQIASVDLVQIMFAIEETFDIYLAEQEVGLDVQNVGEVIAAVQRLVAEKGAAPG